MLTFDSWVTKLIVTGNNYLNQRDFDSWVTKLIVTGNNYLNQREFDSWVTQLIVTGNNYLNQRTLIPALLSSLSGEIIFCQSAFDIWVSPVIVSHMSSFLRMRSLCGNVIGQHVVMQSKKNVFSIINIKYSVFLNFLNLQCKESKIYLNTLECSFMLYTA